MRIEVRENAKRNIYVGLVQKILLMVLSFLVRTVINYFLGAEYLGLNSVYSSIFTMLGLSELGLGLAMVYHMYKPIAEDNYTVINSLLFFYKKAYLAIGIFITSVGIILIPFIHIIIKADVPKGINIYYIYLIQLMNTSLGYFLYGYKQALLTAYQREDIISLASILSQGLGQIIQIVILAITKDYYYYVIVSVLITAFYNLFIKKKTEQLFPYAKAEGKLDYSTKKSIAKTVSGAFIQRVCDVTRNTLDSIVLSSFFGLVLTAVYNNYFLICSSVNMFLNVVIGSISAGVGNHIVVKTVEENFEELKKIDFIYLILQGWCAVNIVCIIQPFMRLWMGETMLFPMKTVILMATYFYVGGLGKIRAVYYGALGMWWEMRFRSCAEVITNIFLNIVLGYFWGVNGIVVATIISLIAINFVWGNNILFGKYFEKKRLISYYLYQLEYAFKAVCIAVSTFVIVNNINASNLVGSFVVKAIASLGLSSILFWLFYKDTSLYKEVRSYIFMTKN